MGMCMLRRIERRGEERRRIERRGEERRGGMKRRGRGCR